MRIATFVTGTALSLLSTIALAQSVTFDFDKTTDFSTLRTYAWVPGAVVDDPLNHQRIVSAIDAQLASKRMLRVSAGERPDALVAYHASFERDLQITGFASGWGPYRFPGSRSAVARTEQIVTGTIVVDVVNAHTRTIVWRGIASKELDVTASAAKRDKNIDKAAAKLFKAYPPVE